METRTQARIVVDASRRGQELRYVTAHFRDLQGLRMAPFWIALLVLDGLATTGSFSRGRLTWAVLAVSAMQFGWLYVSGRWYEQRYGLVKEPEPPVRSGLISIMQPDVRPPRAPDRYYGYFSGKWAVVFLIWALIYISDIFRGRGGLGFLVMTVVVFQLLLRCVYPVTGNWSIFLRRILAITASIAIIGSYVEYRFAQMGLWTCVTALFSALLLLDFYDHWLLNHLLNGGSMEGKQ